MHHHHHQLIRLVYMSLGRRYPRGQHGGKKMAEVEEGSNESEARADSKTKSPSPSSKVVGAITSNG